MRCPTTAAVDVLAVGTFGRGVFTLYDVTSYFPQATVLQFGLADNNSMPDASFLTNGTSASRQLIKYGIGTLTIAGDATYTGGTTINRGAVVLGVGGSSGSILGNVTFCNNAADPNCDASNNKALAFNRSDTYTFGGVDHGPGQVFQIGSGKTVLTGASDYSGPTFVNAGTLSVNGSITSSVFVNNGGTLGGNGSVGSTTILSGRRAVARQFGRLDHRQWQLGLQSGKLVLRRDFRKHRRPHQRDGYGDAGRNGRCVLYRRHSHQQLHHPIRGRRAYRHVRQPRSGESHRRHSSQQALPTLRLTVLLNLNSTIIQTPGLTEQRSRSRRSTRRLFQ